MMDLQEAWKKLETDKLTKPVTGAVHIQKKSKHPVQKLKTAYLQTTGFSVVFLIGFIALLFYFHEPLVKIGLVLVILSYIFFFVTNFSMYRKINVVLPIDKNLKQVLAHTHQFITDNIRFQKRVALFIYPIAGTAGFMMGGSVGGGNVEKMMQDPTVLLLAAIVMTVLTPLCYYLANWMYKISYGKCLVELQERIDQLEDPN
jgi:hypothetical protein